MYLVISYFHKKFSYDILILPLNPVQNFSLNTPEHIFYCIDMEREKKRENYRGGKESGRESGREGEREIV